MDKEKVFQTVLEKLTSELEEKIKHTQKTVGATHEAEGRMKTRYDSSKTELGYLASAQADRVLELEQNIHTIKQLPISKVNTEKVHIGTIVSIQQNQEEQQHYFLLPCCGGTSIEYEGKEIIIITPQAPMGQAMLHKEQGSQFMFREKTYNIKNII